MLVLPLCMVLMIVVVIALFDIIPIAKEWFGRIHIGRYSSREQWRDAISRVGFKWLNAAPKLKITDNTRLIALDVVRGKYSKSTIQQWQEAAILLGLSEMAKNGLKPAIKKQVDIYLHARLDEDGGWREPPRHVDIGILAYGLMKLPGGADRRCKLALDQVWELIQAHIGSDGTVQYRTFMPNYRYVDTIGFICPFLIAYGLRYDKQECIELAVKQLEHYDRFGMLNKSYIPSHAYHIESGLPAGLYGWGRGLGWFAIGLIDAWLELPNTHAYKQTLEGMVRKFAVSSLSFQNENGSWSWSVNRSEARADSSTTAALGWFLKQASALPSLQESCSEGASKAQSYLMKVTRRNGAIDFSQGDTKDIGVYSMLFSIMPFTQGFSMRMSHANLPLEELA
ncbi:glycoside hydrolase family 88 protein [Paenibacillus sp. HB172176]|uniref:glycoside hydrolase family 88 protein n=1 Tax=Paenibacillus sp. HB172176 TaxID=2493690 RepID=UPI00143A0272|nr:glycoside hydrolase family 88 protein [Paenibacillus sp. HB172176]